MPRTHCVVQQPNYMLRISWPFPEALEAAGRAKDLLRDVSDPIIRSGFRNTFAHALMLASRYREGEEHGSALPSCASTVLSSA